MEDFCRVLEMKEQTAKREIEDAGHEIIAVIFCFLVTVAVDMLLMICDHFLL